MAVSLKYDTAKKKAEHCKIFIRKYLLQVINVGDDIVQPIFL